MAIKYLFGKPLFTCDFPDCGNSLHLTKKQLENPTDKIKEYNWLAFELPKSRLIVFLCRQHKFIQFQTDKQIEKIKANAHKISEREIPNGK